MKEVRINGKETMMDVMFKMSDGNPGALTALMEIFKENPKIDPQDFLQGLGPILSLDSMGIYGTDIYVLYSDICNRDLPKMLAVIRSVQLGLFTESILKDACSRQDYSGRTLIPVEELYLKVKERLEEFDR